MQIQLEAEQPVSEEGGSVRSSESPVGEKAPPEHKGGDGSDPDKGRVQDLSAEGHSEKAKDQEAPERAEARPGRSDAGEPVPEAMDESLDEKNAGGANQGATTLSEDNENGQKGGDYDKDRNQRGKKWRMADPATDDHVTQPITDGGVSVSLGYFPVTPAKVGTPDVSLSSKAEANSLRELKEVTQSLAADFEAAFEA